MHVHYSRKLDADRDCSPILLMSCDKYGSALALGCKEHRT